MKKIIKITLIGIVVIGIIFAVFRSIKIITDNGTKDVIATTNFEKSIQAQVDSKIKDHSYEEAKNAFDSIMGVIKTEASITLSDDSRNLSALEEENCKQLAFAAYAPIFTEYGNDYFFNESWNDNTLNSLKKDAETLLVMNIAEYGTDVYKQLRKIIDVVDKYYNAKDVVIRASRCTGVDDIARLKKEANSYLQEPLTNNTSLAASLRLVEKTAKSSVVQSIAANGSRVANNYSEYSDYAVFSREYNSAIQRINDYENTYGKNSKLSATRQVLHNADNYALQYFAEKEKQLSGMESSY